MTKKDYIKIADVLKPYYNLLPEYEAHQAICREIIYGLANMLSFDNPAFNKQKFIDYLNK